MTRRVSQVIKIKPECVEEYKRLHANPPAEVLNTLKRANFSNYSISYSPQLSLLFARFDYIGTNFEEDMKKCSDCSSTRAWWKVTDSLQESLVEGATGSGGEMGWWKDLDEVFYFGNEKEA